MSSASRAATLMTSWLAAGVPTEDSPRPSLPAELQKTIWGFCRRALSRSLSMSEFPSMTDSTPKEWWWEEQKGVGAAAPTPMCVRLIAFKSYGPHDGGKLGSGNPGGG